MHGTEKEENMRNMRNFSQCIRHLSLIGQLGLSLVTPVLMCLGAAYLLVTRLGLGLWVYLPAFILGLGASFMTAYKVYLSAMRRREPERRRAAFNRHY